MAHTPTPWYCGVGELIIMANSRPGCQHKRIAVCDSGTITEQADYDNRDHIVKVVNQHADLVAALTAWSEYMVNRDVPFALSHATRLALASNRYIAPAGWDMVST
jgi:hypothetical protein